MMRGGHDDAAQLLVALTGMQQSEASTLMYKWGDVEKAANAYFTQQEAAALLENDNEKIRWVSFDPKRGYEIGYPPNIQEQLERNYRAGSPARVAFNISGQTFHISAIEFRQYNSAGKHRTIARKVSPKSMPGLSQVNYENCLEVVKQIDKQIDGLENTSNIISIADKSKLASVYGAFDQIIKEYVSRNSCLIRDSSDILRHSRGDPVPHYYANVKGESVERRKLLSLLGLRNLLDAGIEIYNEMRTRLFSSNFSDYTNNVGVHRMKTLTGNAVDLDTTVLRCSDGSMLKTINSVAKKQDRSPYRSPEEFGNSKEAADMARAAASTLIEDFCNNFKLSPADRRRRCLELSAGPIPVNTSSRDRGKSAIWQYIGPGVNSFHVNVPNMDDVIGALLRSPWHAVKCWSKIHLLNDEREREEWIEKFFTECIEDSCFNAKWKSINSFCEKLAQYVFYLCNSCFSVMIFCKQNTQFGNHKRCITEIRKAASGRCDEDFKF